MRRESVSRLKRYAMPAIAYGVICIILLLLFAVLINKTVTENDKNQINYILELTADKVNISFNMMTGYVEEMADYISTRSDFSFEQCYEELNGIDSERPYFSVGFIDNNGNIYGNAGEKIDIEKHNYNSIVSNIQSTYITEPYRSCVTGNNIITMFSPIYNKGKYIGNVFMSYYLETVQDLAYTEVFSGETDAFLMNPYSGNFVTCYEGDDAPPGVWSNLRLIDFNGNDKEEYDYNRWIESMKNNNSKENVVNVNRNGINYTQAFASVSGMKDWYVLIRVPLNTLSIGMKYYARNVALCAILLVIVTIVFAVFIFAGEWKQKQKLKNLSDIDALTKIINRRGFQSKVEKYFDEKSENDRFIFMFIDIDYFKSINDTYGHSAGDDVLCCVADILVDKFSRCGIVSRVGGDEFNIFIYKSMTEEETDTLMANVRVDFGKIKTKTGQAIPVTFSAGIAVYPNDADNFKELINCADKALYNVKEKGRNNHCRYMDIKENL